MKPTWLFLDTTSAKRLGIQYPDVYFSAEYGVVVQQSDKAAWELAVCTFPDQSKCYYCYLKRPVSDVSAGHCAADLVSPYGYCGPWSEGPVSEKHWFEFRQGFLEHALKKRYIAEFIRLSPLLNEEQSAFRSASSGLTIWSHQTTVAVDLSRGVESYMQRSSKKHRRAVNKALRLGYTASISPATHGDLENFIPMYLHTMKRTEAHSYYLFGDSYFAALVKELRGRLHMVSVTLDGKYAAASLYIVWGELMHYHLGASYEEFLGDGVNDLVHHAAARWGTENGIKLQHLGGGRKDGDSLFSFKNSVGDVSLTWYLAKGVIDQSTYDKLVLERAKKLGKAVHEVEVSGFFPAYRCQ